MFFHYLLNMYVLIKNEIKKKKNDLNYVNLKSDSGLINCLKLGQNFIK